MNGLTYIVTEADVQPRNRSPVCKLYGRALCAHPGAEKERPTYIWISAFPIALFLFLDAYYLGLERRFRDLYNVFIKKVHGGGVTVEDVFIVTPGSGGRILLSAFLSLFSISVLPFYGFLAAMLMVVRFWVLGSASP